jgi:hypothetical protein
MDREQVSFFLDSQALRNYEPLSIQRVVTDILCGDFDNQLDLITATIARRKHILLIAPKMRRIVLRRAVVLKRTGRKVNGVEAGKNPEGTTAATNRTRTFTNT